MKVLKMVQLMPILLFIIFSLNIAIAENCKPETDKIKVFIVDGQNGHGWVLSSGIIAEFLKETGRFVVDEATSPPKGHTSGSR